MTEDDQESGNSQLWKNLCALAGGGDAGELIRVTGVPRTTAYRIRDSGKASADTLDFFAAKFGLEVWQLFVPGIKIGKIPSLLWPQETTIVAPTKPPDGFKDGPLTLNRAEIGLIEDLRMLEETGRDDEVRAVYKTVHESAGVARKMKDHILKKYLPAKEPGQDA